MKTLEEKAKEAFVILGDKYFNILKETNPRGDFKHFIKMAVEYGFRNGYKAAFEWISVEDELPAKEMWIIAKSEYPETLPFYKSMFYVLGNKEQLKINFTHWRPINNY